MQDYQSCLYSTLLDINIGHLKNGEYENGFDVTSVQQWMQDNDIHAIREGLETYHYKFSHIKSKPYIVYHKGDLSILNKPILAIVGPRKPTQYALEVLDNLFQSLKSYDIVTVSGMAPGVDQYVHGLSMQHNIPTIAVLGGGMRNYIQSSNRMIIDEIVSHGGLVVSEFKLDQRPETYTFPQRNRIIAGLADAVFLPEAGKKSGSLITVDFAYQMNKPVYGVPNNIFSPQSEGLHDFISQKKINIVHKLDDMLKAHFHQNTSSSKSFDIPDSLLIQDQQILQRLEQKPESNILDCLHDLNISYQELLMSVTNLEIEKLIYQPLPGVFKVYQ